MPATIPPQSAIVRIASRTDVCSKIRRADQKYRATVVATISHPTAPSRSTASGAGGPSAGSSGASSRIARSSEAMAGETCIRSDGRQREELQHRQEQARDDGGVERAKTSRQENRADDDGECERAGDEGSQRPEIGARRTRTASTPQWPTSAASAASAA